MAESNFKNYTSYVKQYYALLGKNAIREERLLPAMLVALSARKDDVIVSSRFLARCIAKLRGIERPLPTEIEIRAFRYYALLDAFSLLQHRGVPVFYFQRIADSCETSHFTDNERRRMKDHKSFVEMINHFDQNKMDLQEIFGEGFSRGYVESLSHIPQVIRVDGSYKHEDCSSQYINVVNGKRVTTGQPTQFCKTVHVYGRCGAFGYAVEDGDSMPSQLQHEFQKRGADYVRVINHGLWGGYDSFLDHNFIKEAIDMKEDDIIVFYRRKPDDLPLREMQKRGVQYRDFSIDWHRERTADVTFFDRPGHMNAPGYHLLASFIADELIKNDFGCTEKHLKSDLSFTALNQYIKMQSDSQFLQGVKTYIDSILQRIDRSVQMSNNGAIVMNCNPFTYGHRYLIEYAAKRVDTLFIFVVEENKSFFDFHDRYKMVVDGTSDIKNVIVVPSGKFIISAYTFPEYFMKDYVKNKEFDVSIDIETFCKYIAHPLGIKTRFAGQEPLDPVTNNYNESMKRILPKYDMIFVEIPRLVLDSSEIVNATKVRELLAEGKRKELRKYVPDSTYRIIMDYREDGKELL